MRTLLVVPMTVTLLGSMLLSVGCVSRKEFDDLNAANRRMKTELDNALAALQNMQMENQKLQTELQNRDLALAADKDRIAALEGLLATARAKIDDLNRKLAAGGVPAPIPTGIALGPKMDKFLKDLAAKYPKLFTYYPGKGMVKLSSDLTFEKGSDVVRPQAKEAIKEFLGVFNIKEAAPYHIYIAGHTDDIPILKGETKRHHPNNWYLSVHRAVAVQEEMVNDSFAPEKIGAMGFGEYHPVAPNAAGHKGNELNRRVELWIVPPERFLTLTTVAGGEEGTEPEKATPKEGTPKEPAEKTPDEGDEGSTEKSGKATD